MNMTDKPRLILMRHAKSSWSDVETADFDRRLAERGKKVAPRIGKWLRKRGYVPDVLVSSPARRARDTAILVGREFDIPKARIAWDKRIYEAGTAELLDVLKTHAECAGGVLIVGHNPGLDELLLFLCADEPARDAKGRLLTTGAVAVLTFAGKFDFAAGRARLKKLMRPKDL
ncbi:MAG: SixA phosphatase family protein [Gammaproteobacteria bacterium]